jgi:ABC-type polysaccharide/polyol phosphate export permease
MRDAATGRGRVGSLGVVQALQVLLLILRREGSNLSAIVANGLLLPAFICYAAFMVTPAVGPQRLRWAIGGVVLALGTMSLNQIYFAVASDRLLGGLKMLSANGVSGGIYILAYLIYAVILATIVAFGGVAFLALSGLADLDIVSVLSTVAACQLAGFALGMIGAGIGLTVRSFGMGDVVSNSVGMLGIALSPVFYSIELVPFALRPFVELSPYTQLAKLLDVLAEGGAIKAVSFLLLGATGVVATLYAFIAFRRTNS